MSFFEFPHTRTYDSDLGWLIKHTKELLDCCSSMTDWAAKHEREYEILSNKVNGLINNLTEVIKPWDPSIAYQIFTIVEYLGSNYIAIQDVPVGANITDPTYWAPANTIVEQINAMGLVVSTMLQNWNVVPEFSDLAATTTDQVIVLYDDSYFGSGQTVRFVKADHPLPQNPELLRDNGDYMMPVPLYSPPNTAVPANAIGEVIGSYLNQPSITAGGTRTPFHMSVANPDSIDCSSFATLITRGISYENSRFVIDENIPSPYAGGNLPRNPESLTVSNKMCYNCGEMGLFYAEQNRLFWMDYDLQHPVAQLQTGDLLFNSDIAVQPNRYLYLEHVQVVLAVYPESDLVLIAHTGGGIYNQPIAANTWNECRLSFKRITGTAEDIEKTRVFARPSYSFAESPAKAMLAYASQPSVQTPATPGRATLSRLYFKELPKKNKIYTVVCKGTLPNYVEDGASVGIYVSFPGGTGNFYNAIAYTAAEGDKLTFMFVPGENIENMTAVTLVVYVGNDDVVNTQTTCEIEAVEVYEGVQPDAVPNVYSETALINVNADFGAIGTNRLIHRYDDPVLDLSARLDVAPAADGYITIGTLDPTVFPISNNARYAYATKGGDIRSARVTATNNELQVYALTGETGTFVIHTSIDS